MPANDPPEDETEIEEEPERRTSPQPQYDEETIELIKNVEAESHPMPDISDEELADFDFDPSEIDVSEVTVAGYVPDEEAARRGEMYLEQVREMNGGELPEGYQQMIEAGVFSEDDPVAFYRNVLTPQITRRQRWFEQEMQERDDMTPFRPDEKPR